VAPLIASGYMFYIFCKKKEIFMATARNFIASFAIQWAFMAFLDHLRAF
jgi:hypothetical protein